MSIVFPEMWATDQWYGFTRHHFEFEGRKAWIVEPRWPAPDCRWSWCTQWAEAFVPRVGTVALLEHGFYHVHIDVYEFRASPKGVGIMGRFQEMLVKMGFSPKANLIGMSWGGFFALRYAETYPQNVCAIYLDAPLCNASDPKIPTDAERNAEITEQFGISFEERISSPLNPVNNVQPLVDAGIPIFAAVGQADETLDHEVHFDLFEKKYLAAGGKFYNVVRRDCWGHHPHGFDDVEPLLEFHWKARE